MPPRPYRSRFFNFINRQWLDLQERFSIALRQFKVALVWGMQLLVSPFFWLTHRAKAGQIGQEEGTSLPSLESPLEKSETATDAPIRQVLVQAASTLACDRGEVEKREVSEAKTNSSQPNIVLGWIMGLASRGRSHPTICGVATQLTPRRLVLVGEKNQILDILTPQQRQQLQQRIDEALTPPPSEKVQLQKALPAHVRLSLAVDRTIARARVRLRYRRMSLGHLQGNLAFHSRLEAALDYFFGTSSQPTSIADDSTLSATQLNGRSPHPLVVPVAATRSKLKALLEAALDYFYGHSSARFKQLGSRETSTTILGSRGDKLARSTAINANQELSSPVSLAKILSGSIHRWLSPSKSPTQGGEKNDDADGWLSWDDLYQHNSTALSEAGDTAVFSQAIAGEEPLQRQSDDRKIWVAKKDEITLNSSDSTAKEDQGTDYLEAQVLSSHYHYHPLERLLQGLDRLMLWLEEWILRLSKTCLHLIKKLISAIEGKGNETK